MFNGGSADVAGLVRGGGLAGPAVVGTKYQPLDAQIGTMRRLRVTKGVYLPADTPLHGVFGSKDVIHS